MRSLWRLATTPVAEGMEVVTNSDRLLGMRQESLQRLLVHHPLDCPICDKAGECRLQDLVFEYGIKAEEYQAPEKPYDVVYATPLIKHWPDRCVHVPQVCYGVQRDQGRLRFGCCRD